MGNIVNKVITNVVFRFPGGSDGKVSVCNAGDTGSIPGSGRSPGERNGNPLQYSCLENTMDEGAWQATVHGVAKSRTRLNDFSVIIALYQLSHKGMGFPDSSAGKESACNAGDPGSIPGLGRSPGEGNGSLLQYSCLENPMDHGVWQAMVHGVVKSRTRLSYFTFTFKRKTKTKVFGKK